MWLVLMGLNMKEITCSKNSAFKDLCPSACRLAHCPPSAFLLGHDLPFGRTSPTLYSNKLPPDHVRSFKLRRNDARFQKPRTSKARFSIYIICAFVHHKPIALGSGNMLNSCCKLYAIAIEYRCFRAFSCGGWELSKDKGEGGLRQALWCWSQMHCKRRR